MDPTNTTETFAASVKNYVLQTLQTFYFLSQDVDEILTILMNNDFDAKDTWWEMNDGSGDVSNSDSDSSGEMSSSEEEDSDGDDVSS